MITIPWLTLTWAFPMVGAALLLLVPEAHERAHRALAYLFAGLAWLTSLTAASVFRASDSGLQMTSPVERIPWMPSLGAEYAVGVDGLSLGLVLLTTTLLLVLLVGGGRLAIARTRGYSAGMLAMSGAMTGAFLATDLLLYFLFWEVMLIPAFLMVASSRREGKSTVTLRFLLYTMAGSALLLSALLYVWAQGSTASFDLLALREVGSNLGMTEQVFVLVGFATAFLIKVPMFPLHTWSPGAYEHAPAPAAAMMSGVMAKVGAYGLLRFAIPLAPDAAVLLAPSLAALAVGGIVYGAWVAWNETSVVRMLAYSSMSHLGFVVLGIVSLQAVALSGAVLQCIAHGLATGGLLLAAGILAERYGIERLDQGGGLARRAPLLSVSVLVLAMASAAVPGFVGFAGEFLILLGASQSQVLNFGPASPGAGMGFGPDVQGLVLVAGAVLGVVLGVAYLLRAIQRIFFGAAPPDAPPVQDLRWNESVGLLVPGILCLVLGFFPQLLLSRITPAAQALTSQLVLDADVYQADLTVEAAVASRRRALRAEGSAVPWPMKRGHGDESHGAAAPADAPTPPTDGGH
jgi:NADH-quinone oxidoreductase subunit M